MRPSVTEQLAGLSRILAEVIAPELENPYPRDILGGVCATLDAIAAGWTDVPAFLDWDARTSIAVIEHVLADGSSVLSEELQAETRASLTQLADPVDPFDIAALQQRHRAARKTLERVIPALGDIAELSPARTELASHLKERAARYPFKPVWRPAQTAPR